MRNRYYFSIIIGLFMLAACMAGCAGKSETSATTLYSEQTTSVETTLGPYGMPVTDMMQIDPGTVKSLKLLRMGDGKTVIIENRDEIGRILIRLSQISFVKDLGQQGYTPDGFTLEFTVENDTGTHFVSVQLDTSEHSFIGSFNKHIYQLVDAATDGNLADYLNKAGDRQGE